MIFKKQIIDEMFKCYSNNSLNINGKTELLFAGEGPGIMKKYYGENFKNSLLLWDADSELGGTMSVVTVPDYENVFFVSTGFFSMVDSEKSKIFIVKVNGNKVSKKQIAEIDYLHRFGVTDVEGKRYLIAASLHGGKKDKPDWSKPGSVYGCEIPMDLDQEFTCEFKTIKDGLFINHGFSIGNLDGKRVALIGSEVGGFAVRPPQNGNDWEVEKILDFPVSDLAAIDLDGDGEEELAVLNPFHGNHFGIYKRINGVYDCLFEYEKPLDFYHAITADTLNEIPTVVIGARKDDMDLFIVQYDKEKGEYFSQLVDTNVGPANVSICHMTDGTDLIVSSNRQINEAAIYIAEK